MQTQIKYRFAEDGHPETQFGLARNLLSDEGDEAKTNQERAVYWLIRATSQGHNEAFVLLQDCYKTGKGISEANESEVAEALGMSDGERAARRAAKEVFNYLSNGDKYITVAQLERKLREIYKLDKRGKNLRHLNGGAIGNGGGEPDQPFAVISQRSQPGISEANLIAAAVHYAHGHLPFDQIVISVPSAGTLDHIPCFHRPFFNPSMFFLLLYHRFVGLMSSLPGTVFSNLQLIVVLSAYCIFNGGNFVKFIPLATYYATFAIMTVATFKMLKKKHEFVDFRLWSGLFLRYGDHQVDAEESESRFLRNNLAPFVVFFTAFVVNLMVHPLLEWLPNSELTVVSFSMSFITLFAFMFTTSARNFPDYSVLVSFGLNVLAKYPYEMDSVVTTGWRFLDLKVPAFSTFVIGNGIEFCINCRALLYLTIPGCLLYLALRENWRGTCKYLLPHCVTLAWLQLCIISSQSATAFGLVRAALGVSGMLLFLPLFGLATILIPIFACIEWLSLSDPTLRLMTAVIATLLAIGASILLAGFHRTERYITTFQMIVCVAAIVFLTAPYMHHPEYDESPRDLFHHQDLTPAQESAPNWSWDVFYKYCKQPAWDSGASKMKTQIRCAHLDGTRIYWQGSVLEVEIAAIRNVRLHWIRRLLPEWLAEVVVCYYGEPNKDDCLAGEECGEIRKLISEQNQCNLDKWNL